MTDLPDASHGEPKPPAPTGRMATIGRRALDAALAIARRSIHNRRQTFALIAHRRLWRQSAYPKLPWKTWLCYAAAAIAIMLAVFDEPVGSFGRQWPPRLVALAETLTRTGLSGWYLFPTAFVCLVVNLIDWSALRGRRLLVLYNWTMLTIFVFLSVGVPGLIVTFLKHFIGRARPFYFAEIGAYAFQPLAGSSAFASMPSGHACTIGSMAMVLVLLAPSLRFLIVPLALALATTRIVLSAHYPSDVVAGLALGASCTIIIALVFARLGYIFRSPANGLPRRRRSFSVFW